MQRSRGKLDTIRHQWEYHQEGNEALVAKHSSMLAELEPRVGLRTPCRTSEGVENNRRGGNVYATQQELIKKHHDAKSKIAGVKGVGGGLSMWPAMDDMRLSRNDIKRLFLFCILITTATVVIFFYLHGLHIAKLNAYSTRLVSFHDNHPIRPFTEQSHMEENLLKWHSSFLKLQEEIHKDFDVVWLQASFFDVSFFILYIVGIVVLLYFLVDNMFSKSRLTPRRIKIWISLLCVVMTWTVLSTYLLVCAQAVESATQATVHQLTQELAYLVETPLDLSRFQSVLLYWRTLCLPPTSTGVLSVVGVVKLQDLAYYLQYYSLPILTAICTPIVKIVVSLRTVYSNTHRK